jgi:hemoglobin
MENLYEKYGFDKFHYCILQLYLDLYDHPEIAYHFIGVDLKKLALHQAEFLCSHIGGPTHMYKGQELSFVHENMDITPFQFREIAKVFKKIFLENDIDKSDVKTIMEFIAQQRKGIVTAKWSFMDFIMIPIYKIYAYISKRRNKKKVKASGLCLEQ